VPRVERVRAVCELLKLGTVRASGAARQAAIASVLDGSAFRECSYGDGVDVYLERL
jgi:hypothetical protein